MRAHELLTEVKYVTYVSVIAQRTGTKAYEWEEADGPQIGPGQDQWYVHTTTNQVCQVSELPKKALFVLTTEDGDHIDSWELT